MLTILLEVGRPRAQQFFWTAISGARRRAALHDDRPSHERLQTHDAQNGARALGAPKRRLSLLGFPLRSDRNQNRRADRLLMGYNPLYGGRTKTKR